MDSLSPFKLLKCLTGGEKSIVKCLLDFGIRTVPKSIAKKIGLKVTDQCGDVLDLSSWFGSGSCRAGDPQGWHQRVTPTPPNRPALTTQQPPVTQPQPTVIQPPAASSPLPAPPVTQTGQVDIDPDTAAYGGVVNVWSLPARNDFCNANFPTCDPSSMKIYQVAQGQSLTALCYRPDGQRIITGTIANPGYDDRRWVRLASGGWLPNTWFVRGALDPALPTC